jgi:methylmalonyl-CoA mutase N-terminal domain/subunit
MKGGRLPLINAELNDGDISVRKDVNQHRPRSVIQAPLYAEDCGYAVHLPIHLRLRLAADCIEFCSKEMPRFHSFVEDTYYISESGLDSIEEMALGFIEIRWMVRELLRRGVPIDRENPQGLDGLQPDHDIRLPLGD